MMNKELFWKRAQGILDQRGDPLEDPDIREYLLEHPGDLAALVALRSALKILEESKPRETGFRRRLLATLAAAAAVLLVCWLWIQTDPGRASRPRGEILDFEIRLTTRTPHAETVTVHSPEGSQTVTNISTHWRFSHD